jgi:hypothetical protein
MIQDRRDGALDVLNGLVPVLIQQRTGGEPDIDRLREPTGRTGAGMEAGRRPPWCDVARGSPGRRLINDACILLHNVFVWQRVSFA